jgi:HK97 family phage major capsid protein
MPQHETDVVLLQKAKEVEERQAFIDKLVAEPKGENGDLSDEQLQHITEQRERIKLLSRQMDELTEVRELSSASADRIASIAHLMARKDPPAEVEYRSVGGLDMGGAGAFALDLWDAALGDVEARSRLERWNREHRAAAHQTTSNASGLVPTPIVAPVINFIDAARPVVSALGPRQLPSWSFSRPKVTVHTAVAAQGAEKSELTSQAMTITKLAVSPATYGGYVNVSRQLIDYGTVGGGSAMDIVIGDLATQYAILTEATAVQAFYAGGTTGTVTIPGTPTSDNVAAAFWGAAGQVYNATKGQGRLIAAASPDVLGSLGGLFAPVNPIDAQSAGFTAGTFGQGAMGAIGGIPVYVTAGFGTATKRLIIMSTAAGEVYEDRIGPLSVVEPSVLGVQVAYAGNFASLVTEAGGIVKVTVT